LLALPSTVLLIRLLLLLKSPAWHVPLLNR